MAFTRNTGLRTYGLLASVVCVLVLGMVPVAHAAPLTATGTAIDTAKMVASLVITIMNFFMWLLFMALDIVMNPTWIFDVNNNGTDGPLLQMLREIWQLSRDLVNMALAFALIYGTLKMIFTADSAAMKTALPKIAAALVIVNFSWFLPRVVFDISNVATYTVFQIPSLLNAGSCTLPPLQGSTTPRKCKVAADFVFLQNDPPGAGWSCDLRPLVCIKFVDYDSPEADVLGTRSKIINGLIVNHARLQGLVQLSDPRAGGLGPAPGNPQEQLFASIGVLVKLIVILVFHIALLFPIAAMVAAFFLRIPILWVTMAFMPLVALSYAGDFEKLFGDNDPKKILMDQFIKAAFLPARVAVPFTIGFIMVNAGAQTAAPAGINALSAQIPIFSQVDTVWQLIWMSIAIFIVWKYSFEALNSGPETTKFATEKIRGLGQTAMQLAVKYPLAQPILPGGATPLQLAKTFSPRNLLAQINSSGQAPKLNLNNAGNRPNANQIVAAQTIQTVGNSDPTFTAHMEAFRKSFNTNDLKDAINALKATAEGQRRLGNVSERDIGEAIARQLREQGHINASNQQQLTNALQTLSSNPPTPPPPRP